ncbi:MAG: hypothetical protein LH609_04475 [Rudanella sp.]|nr:hypothetical protein [Rudanella sp.]
MKRYDAVNNPLLKANLYLAIGFKTAETKFRFGGNPRGNGLFTVPFLLDGLTIVAHHLLFEDFVASAALTQEEVQEFISYAR